MCGNGHRTKDVHGMRALAVLAEPKPWASKSNHFREAAIGQPPGARPQYHQRAPPGTGGGACRSFPPGVPAGTPTGFLYPRERALNICPLHPQHRAWFNGHRSNVYEREEEGMHTGEEGGRRKGFWDIGSLTGQNAALVSITPAPREAGEQRRDCRGSEPRGP